MVESDLIYLVGMLLAFTQQLTMEEFAISLCQFSLNSSSSLVVEFVFDYSAHD
jgi:hypothetical protein